MSISIKNFHSWVATFDGDSAINAEEWLKTLIMATKILGKDDSQKVMFLVQSRLRDKATVWWVSVKCDFYDEKDDKERTELPPLSFFLKAFKEEYMNADERRCWLMKFCSRKQKWEESVGEYLAALKDLKARSGYQVMPDMMLASSWKD